MLVVEVQHALRVADDRLDFPRLRMMRLSTAIASTSSGVSSTSVCGSKSRNTSRVLVHLLSTTRHEMPVWKTTLLITSR
jgi:hypothetical protein